ncbi:MAG: hypothetical protein QXF82_00855 [Nitrososphaeria archaeon]
MTEWIPYTEFYPLVRFEKPGDQVIGEIVGVREIKTCVGTSNIVDINCDGNMSSFFMSAGMPDFRKLIGLTVKIVYEGLKKNEKSKREFKAFKVYVRQDVF